MSIAHSFLRGIVSADKEGVRLYCRTMGQPPCNVIWEGAMGQRGPCWESSSCGCRMITRVGFANSVAIGSSSRARC